MPSSNRRLVQYGDKFFELKTHGEVDGDGNPIRYCKDCSAEYEGIDIYHRVKSAIFKN